MKGGAARVRRASPGRSIEARVAEIRERANALVRSGDVLRAATSPAIERANLRLLGVDGLDPSGQPLAATVVERCADAALGGEPGRIGLALASAARERGVGPRDMALEVAAGRLDLAAEAARLLAESDRRAAAAEELGRWTAEANQRIDANRTARRELSDGLGSGEQPWLGARIRTFTFDAAECRAFVAVGADVLVVRVPPGRELSRTMGEGTGRRPPVDLEPPPVGSQRGLGALRALLDEAAAERGAYLRLATVGDGLAAPEQAVVAGFERADIVFLDPFDEISLGIAPERALADHAVAQRLVARSGAMLVLGPGPLIAGREITRGEALPARVRIGRSIAAQAVSVAWARGSGVDGEQLLISSPFEVRGSRDEGPLLLAELVARRMLHPDIGLVIGQPEGSGPGPWRLAAALSLVAVGDVRLVVERAAPADFAARAQDVRAGAALAGVLGRVVQREVGGARGEAGGGAPSIGGALPLGDDVLALAGELAEVAAGTLAFAEVEGWASLVAGW